MVAFAKWRQHAKQLKREIYALSLACRDPRVPRHAKLFAACIVGYAFSPIDLIPDFIPVLGYLDDLILVPVGIALSLKMIPHDVLTECREKAQAAMSQEKPISWVAASFIIAVWILLAVLAFTFMYSALKE
jgi:uncharacterized membrane protein YkvA (DUF1232 family)